MSTSRRTFLKTGSLSVAAMAIGAHKTWSASFPGTYLGIQLYSVRNDMDKDPAGTLKQLSGMGYRFVEHANYHDRKFYGYSPAEFKKLLSGYNLKMPSGHVVMEPSDYDFTKKDFTDKWKHTIEDAAIAGQKYLVSPWLDESLRKNLSDFKSYMGIFNKSGALCRKSGMKFGYHNHDFEFNTRLEGKIIYDLIMELMDPALVAQQLDMGNLFNGGAKAIDIAKKYPGRYELMHVKDEIPSAGKEEKYDSSILGKGIVNPRQICDLGRKSGGTKYFIIEQEAYQNISPLDSSRENFNIMKKWGY